MKSDYKGHVKTNYGPNKLRIKKQGKVKSRRYVRHKANEQSKAEKMNSTSPSDGSPLPPHRRLDSDGRLEYTCWYCGGAYERFKQPVFLNNRETAHAHCMPHIANDKVEFQEGGAAK